jgi:hypothetical protein
MIALIGAFEDAFDVMIPDIAAKTIVTVQDAVNYIMQQQKVAAFGRAGLIANLLRLTALPDSSISCCNASGKALVRVSSMVGNPRFFRRTGPHPIADVAAAAGCITPQCDAVLISGLASLDLAGPAEVSFVASRRYAAALAQTRAAAVVVDIDMLSYVPSGTVPLTTVNPMASWARVAALFHPIPGARPGIHPSAVISNDAHVDGTVEVCAQAVIEAD